MGWVVSLNEFATVDSANKTIPPVFQSFLSFTIADEGLWTPKITTSKARHVPTMPSVLISVVIWSRPSSSLQRGSWSLISVPQDRVLPSPVQGLLWEQFFPFRQNGVQGKEFLTKPLVFPGTDTSGSVPSVRASVLFSQAHLSTKAFCFLLNTTRSSKPYGLSALL